MLPNWYNDYKEKIDESIVKYLDMYFSKWDTPEWIKKLKESVYYWVKWWKRVRSILAIEFYLIFSGKKFKDIVFWDDIITYCIAIELLHAYSLIHDDLPCIDNDELRRWEETVWKKYWESTAVLTWDLLNTMSLEALSNLSTAEDIQILLWYFSRSIWFFWMIWWQKLDIYYENNPDKLDLDKLIETHNKKTWALIESSIVGGIILSSELTDIEKYINFWKKIWLAFQIKDDLLDVEWNKEETGKSVWWEDKWFVHFMWLQKSKEYLNTLLSECKEIIIDLNSEKLNFLVEYIGNRKK